MKDATLLKFKWQINVFDRHNDIIPFRKRSIDLSYDRKRSSSYFLLALNSENNYNR